MIMNWSQDTNSRPTVIDYIITNKQYSWLLSRVLDSILSREKQEVPIRKVFQD